MGLDCYLIKKLLSVPNFVKHHPLIASSAIIISFFLPLYVFVLLRTGLLPGIDGPYYAVQVNSISHNFRLKYPDPPLIFYVMYFFYSVVGNAFLAVALGVSVFVTLSSTVLGYLAFKLTDSLVAGVFSMIIFMIAPFEFRLSGDFMKNAAGLLWVILFLVIAYKGMRSSERNKVLYFVISFATIFCAGLTHILDYGFVLALAAVIPAVQVFLRDRKTREVFYEGLLAGIISLLIFYLFPALQGGDLIKALSIIESITHYGFSSHVPKLVRQYKVPRPGIPVLNEIYGVLDWLAVALLMMLSYFSGKKEEKIIYGSLGIVTALLTVPFWERQVAGRLQLMGGVPLALSLSTVLSYVRNLNGKALVAASIIGLTLPAGILAAQAVTPSISRQAYFELNNALHQLNQTYMGACIVVPDPLLRYWVETLTSKVQASPKYCLGTTVVIALRDRAPPVPAWLLTHIIYRGKYLEIWLLR